VSASQCESSSKFVARASVSSAAGLTSSSRITQRYLSGRHNGVAVDVLRDEPTAIAIQHRGTALGTVADEATAILIALAVSNSPTYGAHAAGIG
jgi:hypothetical protein